MKKLLLLALICLSCQEDEYDVCQTVRIKAEQIRKLSGSNVAHYNREILKLQKQYPQCL